MNSERTRVLVVNDDPSKVVSLQRNLQEDGYRVAFVRDVEQALQVVRREPPEVILIDSELLAADGFKACKVLENNPLTSDIPTIIISPQDEVEKLISCLEGSKVDFIYKPVVYPILVARMNASLSNVRYRQIIEDREDQLRALYEKISDYRAQTQEVIDSLIHEVLLPIQNMNGISRSIYRNKYQSIYSSERLGVILQGNARILNDIIAAYTQLPEVESEDKAELCSLFEIINDVLASTVGIAQNRASSIKVDFNYPLPTAIFVARGMLVRMLLTLLTEVIDTVENASINLSVSCMPFDELVELSITCPDRSHGIPTNQTPKSAGWTRCWQLITDIGGKLEIEASDDGYMCRILLATGSLEALEFVDNHPLRTSLDGYTDSSILKGKVLVVQAENCETCIASMLSGVGLEVISASSGEEGIERALSEQFGLIVMDIELPSMSGLAATEILRRKRIRVPIVAIADAYSQRELGNLAQLGINGYLSLPLQPSDLHSYVKRFFSRAIEDS